MKKGTTKGKCIFSGRLHPIFSPTYYLCPYLFLVPLLLDSPTFYFMVLMLLVIPCSYPLSHSGSSLLLLFSISLHPPAPALKSCFIAHISQQQLFSWSEITSLLFLIQPFSSVLAVQKTQISWNSTEGRKKGNGLGFIPWNIGKLIHSFGTYSNTAGLTAGCSLCPLAHYVLLCCYTWLKRQGWVRITPRAALEQGNA